MKEEHQLLVCPGKSSSGALHPTSEHSQHLNWEPGGHVRSTLPAEPTAPAIHFGSILKMGKEGDIIEPYSSWNLQGQPEGESRCVELISPSSLQVHLLRSQLDPCSKCRVGLLAKSARVVSLTSDSGPCSKADNGISITHFHIS